MPSMDVGCGLPFPAPYRTGDFERLGGMGWLGSGCRTGWAFQNVHLYCCCVRDLVPDVRPCDYMVVDGEGGMERCMVPVVVVPCNVVVVGGLVVEPADKPVVMDFVLGSSC